MRLSLLVLKAERCDCKAACSTRGPRCYSETKKNIHTPKRKVWSNPGQVAQSRHHKDVGDEPTDRCSNVVLTPKKDGESVRAGLDMTDVNKYIKRTRYHTHPKGTGNQAEWS